MCGIVGLFAKTPEVEAKLGDHLSAMLIEMTDRGPDSAGVAVYRNPVAEGALKLSLHSADADYSWSSLARELAEELGENDVGGKCPTVVGSIAWQYLDVFGTDTHGYQPGVGGIHAEKVRNR